MKLTLKNVKELKQKSDSPLFKRVCNYVISEWGNYSDKTKYYRPIIANIDTTTPSSPRKSPSIWKDGNYTSYDVPFSATNASTRMER